ncbi:MAG: phasin family protein [Alphaproteobacteria bacterium]
MAKTNAAPNFDPTAVFAQLKLPNVDMDSLVAAQRRNIEAVSAANKVAADGLKALAARQAEVARSAVDEYVAAVRELMAVKDPQAGAAKQVAFAKSAFEKTVTNMRELAEIATETNVQAFDVLNKRVVEGLDEIHEFAKKA